MSPRYGSHDFDFVVVDMFCGFGGVSKAIEKALGQSPTIAINHNPAAIRAHMANHRGTMHFTEDVFKVAPFFPRGRSPDLLWLSPDCKHHSRAKGGKPVDQKIRALATVALPWARKTHPRIIILENVVEFLGWGPLYPSDHPDKKKRYRPIPERKGEFFRAWCADLEALGYVIEWRKLIACDYGAPTIRARLFLVARCDGRPIVWPEPTHGPGRALPYRTAAECIDWTLPCPSIFLTREEVKAKKLRCRRPLADNTLRRVAEGTFRYVLEDADPYIVPLRGTSKAHRSVHSIHAPLSTISAQGTHHGLVIPSLINTRNGERKGQTPRTHDIRAPLPTVTAQGSQGGLAAIFLAKHYTGVVGHRVDRPLGTITARDHHSVVQVGLEQPPLNIERARKTAAFIVAHYGNERDGQSLKKPLRTIPTVDRFGLVTVELEGVPWVVGDIGFRMLSAPELALAQGFGPDMILMGNQKQQVAGIGNSVSPPVAAALIEAQFFGGPREGQLGLFVEPRAA